MAAACVFLLFGYLGAFTILQRGMRMYYRVGRPALFGDSYLRLIVQMLSMTLLIPAAITLKHQGSFDWHAPQIAGITLVVLGIALSMWAQAMLGQFWIGGVGLHKHHRLIVVGPYRYIRHPLYSGMLLSGVGMGLFSWNLLFSLMALLFTGSFAIRIFAEEHVLQQQFKGHYAAYKAKTGMLVPRLRKGG